MDQDIRSKYQTLNNSFKKTLIYRTGIDAGFFSEYSGMVNAMLFCLQHKLKFKLYSDGANYSTEKGWTDYFQPFCEEVGDKFHGKYNLYRTPSLTKTLKQHPQLFLRMLKWKIKVTPKHFIGALCSLLKYREHTLLNKDIRFKLYDEKRILPELNLNGDYLNDYRQIINVSWHFNKGTQEEVNALSQQLQLPDKYMACQIRGGDKITETDLISPEHYVKQFKKQQGIKDVFVLTDDYRIFQHLKDNYPEFRWHTLCTPEENGYVNSAFTKTDKNKKRAQLIRLFTSIEILTRSTFFIGSITTGPSRFVMRRRYPDFCAIDCRIEDVPQALTLSALELDSLIVKNQ